MNEPNINYPHHTYPVEEPNWVDDDRSTLEESAPLESEFELPASESADPSPEIAERLEELKEGLSYLNQQFDDRLSRDEAKEQAFDYLYQELETVKQDSSLERFKPLYLDLILLFDRLDRVCKEEITDDGELRSFLLTLREELLEVLYRQGIEIVNTDGNGFDPTNQRAIATETTTEREENNTLASVVRRGFRYQNRLLRPEEVVVNKFRG